MTSTAASHFIETRADQTDQSEHDTDQDQDEDYQNSKKNQCKICDKSFPRPYHLKKHIDRVHSMNVKKFVCPICQQLIGEIPMMRIHFKRHHKKSNDKITKIGDHYIFKKKKIEETFVQKPKLNNGRFYGMQKKQPTSTDRSIDRARLSQSNQKTNRESTSQTDLSKCTKKRLRSETESEAGSSSAKRPNRTSKRNAKQDDVDGSADVGVDDRLWAQKSNRATNVSTPQIKDSLNEYRKKIRHCQNENKENGSTTKHLRHTDTLQLPQSKRSNKPNLISYRLPTKKHKKMKSIAQKSVNYASSYV